MGTNPEKLAGMRINLVMEFNAVNGWFAMALYKMGARVKWASNDRMGGVINTQEDADPDD